MTPLVANGDSSWLLGVYFMPRILRLEYSICALVFYVDAAYSIVGKWHNHPFLVQHTDLPIRSSLARCHT